MAKKIIAMVVIVLPLAALGYYWYNHSSKQSNTSSDQTNQEQSNSSKTEQNNPVPETQAPTPGKLNTQTNTATPDHFPAQFSSGEGDAAGPDIQVWEMDYDGGKFLPSTLKIKVNDYVIFKNISSVDVWPASDPHPAHTDYPGFDAGQVVAPGKKYQFQFTKAGSWGLHNHLAPAQTAVIDVVK